MCTIVTQWGAFGTLLDPLLGFKNRGKGNVEGMVETGMAEYWEGRDERVKW